MVDLARQAFHTNNFVLAVEIYERHIAENGPNIEAYLGLADAYARAKELRKAFDAYIQAFRLGNINPSRLDNLVTALLDIMDSQNESDACKLKRNEDPFACGSCKGLWNDPVTIQCGHTYCRPCLDKLSGKTCKVCGRVTRLKKIHAIRTNVLLAQTIENWFPQELLAVKLKAQGNAFFEQSKFAKAIELYSEAFSKAESDHLLASNRSHAFASLQQYSEALKDAERCVSIRPDWPKGYYRKATALAGLSRHEEACLAYLKCLSLDPTITDARTALTKSLHKVLTPTFPEDLKRAEMQLLHHPNPLLLLQNSQSSMTPPSSPVHLRRAVEAIKTSCTASPEQPCSLTHLSAATQQLHVDIPAERSSRPLVKCSSAPCLSEHGDCRSGSRLEILRDAQLESCQSCDKLSRKRSNTGCIESHTSPPNTPVKKTPSSLADHTCGPASHTGLQAVATSAASGEFRTAQPVLRVKRPVVPDKLNIESFECSLCMRLLHEALTTPCGHTFCRVCLDRSLDHTPACPLCKSSLTEYLAERRSLVTEAVTDILRIYFPQHYADRKRVHEEELAEMNSGEEIPIFVCTMAYPKIACPLHIFEPRYRLMIRQCMESGFRQFGMVVSLEANEDIYADFGTMLEIRDVQYFPDGRSVVDCIGGRRFKVRSRGHRHGYHTAKVDFLSDRTLTPEQMQESARMHAETHARATQWFTSLPQHTQKKIKSHFGEIPTVEQDPLALESGPAWHWWLIAVLPLEPRAQLAILAMTSLADRLRAIQRVLTYMSNRQ